MIPPVFTVVKMTVPTLAPVHTTISPGLFTCPVGFTVITKEVALPVHETEPLVKVGVTVMVEVIWAVPLFVAVNAGKLPVPLDNAKPMAVLLLVQAYVVVPPVLAVEKVIAPTLAPLQTN